jgi:hypothetical protein
MVLARYRSKKFNITCSKHPVGFAVFAAVLVVLISGCVSVPERTEFAPNDLLHKDHGVRVAITMDLIDALEAASPGFLDAISGGRGGVIGQLTGSSDYAYASFDMGTADVGIDFRIVLSGGLPISQIHLASIFSNALKQKRTDRLWYVDGNDSLALTFVSQRLMLVARTPVGLGNEGIMDVETISIFSLPGSSSLLIAEILDPSIIADAIQTQGVPSEIAARIPVERGYIVLDPRDEESFSATMKLFTLKPLQARLLGAALVFALQVADVDGNVAVNDVEITISSVRIDLQQLTDMLSGIVKGRSGDGTDNEPVEDVS